MSQASDLLHRREVNKSSQSNLRPIQEESSPVLKWIGWIIFLTYCLVCGVLYALPAYAADEIAFFLWANAELGELAAYGPLGFLWRPNLGGYGAIYWDLYINLKSWFGSYSLVAMRGLAYIAWISIPLGIILYENRISQTWKWLLVLLWISMPMAWWSGKVTGPEVFSVATAFHGLLLLNRSRFNSAEAANNGTSRLAFLGWFVIAMGVGIKLTTAPVLVFAICMNLPSSISRLGDRDFWRRTAMNAIACGLGLLAASPAMLLTPMVFAGQLTQLQSASAWQWYTAKLVLSNDVWAWDGVFSGGLCQWGVAPAGLLVIAIATLFLRVRNAFALMASFLFCWLLIISAGSSLGWYWFGWLPLILHALLWHFESTSRRVMLSALLMVCLLINAFFQSENIYGQISSRIWHHATLEETSIIKQSLLDKIQGQSFDLLLDHSDISATGGIYFPPGIAKDLIQTTPPFLKGLTVATAQANGQVERGILSDSYSRILDLRRDGTQGKRVLLICSNRLLAHQPFANLDDFLAKEVLPKSPKGTTVRWLLNAKYLVVLEIFTLTENIN